GGVDEVRWCGRLAGGVQRLGDRRPGDLVAGAVVERVADGSGQGHAGQAVYVGEVVAVAEGVDVVWGGLPGRRLAGVGRQVGGVVGELHQPTSARAPAFQRA